MKFSIQPAMATTPVTNFWLLLLFIWLISSLLIKFFTQKFLKPKKTNPHHPPTPPSLPIIGHLHLLGFNVSPRSLKSLASRYGPFVRITVAASPLVVVSNAATAREVFKTHDLTFAVRPEFASPDYDIYKDSLFSAAEYGPYWRFFKKICMTQILAAPQLNIFLGVRRQEMMALLTKVNNCAKKREACDIGADLMSMTNNIICRMGMSKRCSGNANESVDIRVVTKGIVFIAGKLALGEILGPLKKFDLFGYGRRLKEMMVRFDNLVDGIMVEKEKRKREGGGEGESRKDMMDILLEIHEDQSAEVQLTRKDIKAFFLDIFIGGTDTTSVGLQWTLARLINNPHAFNKLRQEISTVVGTTRLVEESDVPNLPYLQAVVKEALRLNPPLPIIFRKCRNDCKINGYDIPERSRMVINIYAIMRDPDLWENPDEFVPERFLESSMTNHRGFQQNQSLVDIKNQSFNFSYLPFGSGRRGCPGAGLASAVLHVTIAALVQCFDWKIDGGKVDLEEGSGFSVGMAHPLVCYPVALLNPFEINKLQI